MKGTVKRVFAGFVAGVALTVSARAAFAAAVSAFTSSFPVFVNGVEWELDKPAVLIDGSTYLPLKELAGVLDVSVGWNEDKKRVEISRPGDIVSDAEVVYVTGSGQKFHRQSCRYVTDKSVVMSRLDAQGRGYEPCGICKP